MFSIGVVEGFFGPAWPAEARQSYAEFLSQVGGDFYIYAPKQDAHLRKEWRDKWGEGFIRKLSELKEEYHSRGVKFGVGFSPFGLGKNLSSEDRSHLEEKLLILNGIGIDLLGLFFDDMPTDENLAENQLTVLGLVKTCFSKKIIFCPSYYSFDPILEKVFGKMPEGYLEKIADGVPSDVSIAWTGPKVISPIIDATHLNDVTKLLKRKPFIWENLFANDGPKNCKFLKLRPFDGRDNQTSLGSEAFGFNMMNQPELSKLVFFSSFLVLKNGENPDTALEAAIMKLCSPGFGGFIRRHRETFLSLGLDQIEGNLKESMLQELSGFSDPAAKEILQWLEGKYIVGSECLTD